MDYLSFSMLLSLERLCYGVVWKRPSAFVSLAKKAGMPKKEPEFIFELVKSFKLVQLYVIVTWYSSHYGWSLPSINSTQLMIGLPILLVGQILNVLVWYRIGIDGVCYGCKFGRNVPWCSEFPYSHFNHPQYLGAILTIWGIFVFMWNECTDWYVIPVIETLLYICSMYIWEAN